MGIKINFRTKEICMLQFKNSSIHRDNNGNYYFDGSPNYENDPGILVDFAIDHSYEIFEKLGNYWRGWNSTPTWQVMFETAKNWEEKMNGPIVPFPLDYSHRIHLIEKGELKPAKYELRFMFDWGADSCLWSLDDAAIERYGVGPIDLDELPLSIELKKILQNLCDEHDTALDWDCPQNGLVWDAKTQYDFLERARVACWDTIHELGTDYGVSFNKDNIFAGA